MKIQSPKSIILAGILALAWTAFAESKLNEDKAGVSLVPTFHCISIYWSPKGGGPERKVLVKYRPINQRQWHTGFPLVYHPVDTPECKAEYRGSLVNLAPATTYDIMLALEDSDLQVQCQGTTWSEEFPVKSTVRVSSRDTTLRIDKSGKPGAYVLYDGSNCTIDTSNKSKYGIEVHASYVILRGFTLKNIEEHGIQIFSGHHIVIESCDISKWGSESQQGWGKNNQACIYSNSKELRAVVIQRCKMHHPTWDTNSWAERHGKSSHPKGPQTVVLYDSEGNHVIRYNECWSDKEHYFNDVLGAGKNGSYRGFPGSDSDIYCNYIANCWDDGIEAEGNNQNVRIWNNYIEEVFIPIANAATSIGPLYVWRNVSGRSYSLTSSIWNNTHGPFIKMGYAGGESWMTGHMYIFNNTIFQKNNDGANGLGGNNRIIKHCTTRNNIFHVRKDDRQSIANNTSHFDNDFDYDLTSADFPDNHEKHGLKGSPQYIQGAGFEPKTRTGVFQLTPASRGVDAAEVIPNFCEVIDGKHPSLGAHERGTERMQFGVNAQFSPPGPP